MGGVPTSTFALIGAEQVRIRGVANKAQVTVMETIDADGGSLKRSIIFPGKTARVHPALSYDNVHYDHSVSHWSTPETMIRWADEVLIPHVEQLRLVAKKPDQVAILLLDVWSAHFDETFLRHIIKHKIRPIPIQPGMTGALQPCDHHAGPNRNTKPYIYRMMDTLHMRHVIDTMAAADDSAISQQLAAALKEVEKGAPPLSVGLGLSDSDPTIVCVAPAVE